MSESHPLDRALELEVVRRRRRSGSDAAGVGEHGRPLRWGHGGGHAARHRVHPDRLGEPVALTVNFAAPIADGEFEISRRAPRTNRTNQHWIVELSQGGEVTTTATAVFGNHRDTWSDTEAVMPVRAVARRDSAYRSHEPSDLGSHVRHAFCRGFVLRRQRRGRPVVGNDAVGARRAQRGLDFPALTALSDIFFPRIFLRRGIVPSGTISMTTYFHADSGHLDAPGRRLHPGTAHANRFDRGFFDQSAQLWGRDGALLATTYQIVYFKG